MLLNALLITVHSAACAPPPPVPPPAARAAAASASVRDERRDYYQLEGLVDQWNRARITGNRGLERQVDRQLDRWIRAEIADATQDVHQAAAEAARPAPPRQKADERSDLHTERADRARLLEIARALRDIQPRFTNDSAGPALYERKSHLLNELEELARREIRHELMEVREDAPGARP